MAKKIAKYRFTKKFKKQYKSLPKEIQKEFNEKLSLFLDDISYPSLRVKQIKGTNSRWEGSVTKSYRFTFEFIDGILVFRVIGTHDILLREGRSR
jgi:mRNA-degrading endonuclease RelE of RelBE toxin-antitoxin system